MSIEKIAAGQVTNLFLKFLGVEKATTQKKGAPLVQHFLIVNQDTGSGDSRFELGIGCTAFLLQLWDVFCLDFGIDVGLLSMDFNQETYTNDDDEEIEYIETGTSLLTGAEVYAKVHDPFSDPGKQMTLDIPGMQFTIDGFSISGYWRRPRSRLLKAWIEDSIVARDSIECPDCGAGISEPCFEQASQTHSSRDLGAGEDCTECSAKGSEPCRESLPEIHEAVWRLIVRVRNSATDFQSTPQDWALLSQIIRI